MITARADMKFDGAMRKLRAAQLRALQKAIVALWAELQQVLNVPNTGERRKRLHGRGSYTVYPNPSKPGEPPRKRTGWLQRNVVYEVDKEQPTARVGLTENADYGIYLELGTERMAPRPWLVSTAQRMAPKLARIVREEIQRSA